MKVEHNYSFDTLLAINQQLQKVYNLQITNNRDENLYKSIGYDLADKFDKKSKTLIKKTSLFSHKKRFKITLKFHEAWALRQILIELFPQIENTYQKSLIESTIHTLDQKTC